MVFRNLMIMSAFFICCSTFHIDCSKEDTCFGEPYKCDPNNDCESVFYFDGRGTLHFILRNFHEPKGYAAFIINQKPDETVEYFICIPYDRKRLRATSELGSTVLVTQENPIGVVERLGNTSFRCVFDIQEMSEKFQRDQMFFVTKGVIEDPLIIYDGVQLFNLDLHNEPDYYQYDDPIQPSAHHIGSPIQHRMIEPVAESKKNESDKIVRTRSAKYVGKEESEEESHEILYESPEYEDSESEPHQDTQRVKPYRPTLPSFENIDPETYLVRMIPFSEVNNIRPADIINPKNEQPEEEEDDDEEYSEEVETSTKRSDVTTPENTTEEQENPKKPNKRDILFGDYDEYRRRRPRSLHVARNSVFFKFGSCAYVLSVFLGFMLI